MNKVLFFLFFVVVFCISCAQQNILLKKVSVNDPVLFVPDTVLYRLRPDDKISISIWNNDDVSVGSLFGPYNSNEVYGKWLMLNYLGQITVPQLGVVSLGGLTIKQAEDKLTMAYAKYLVKPTLIIKVLNREITVIGEVRVPGTYTVDKERNTMIDLLAKSQGFDYYADKRNIKLVRKMNGTIREFQIDFTRLDALEVQRLVVLPGDIVSVSALPGKQLDKKAQVLIPVAGILSTFAVLISLFRTL